jgi:hypothetical protein
VTSFPKYDFKGLGNSAHRRFIVGEEFGCALVHAGAPVRLHSAGFEGANLHPERGQFLGKGFRKASDSPFRNMVGRAGTMPANPYDLRSEYGRAAYDNRQRGFISATASLPFRIRMSPFLFLQWGRPYNVTSGIDANGDGNPNDDRPALASDLGRPSVVDRPGFGVFDLAPATLPNAVLAPRNYLEGPGFSRSRCA